MLIGAGLMFRSFRALTQVDLGYAPEGVLTFRLVSEREFLPPAQRVPYQQAIRDRLGALPGVSGVASTNPLPLARPATTIRWGREDAQGHAESLSGTADYQIVLPGYFETLRTPLVDGRGFADADNTDRKVAVIDELLAAAAFPGTSAVGKRLAFPLLTAAPELFEVIGVVGHQRISSLAERGNPQAYFTTGIRGNHVSAFWVVRMGGDIARNVSQIRRELTMLDPRLVISDMQPMTRVVEMAQANTRYSLLLIGAFAIVSVLLTAVGLYGVLASAVRQRTAEIGVRMALGATPGRISTSVLGRGLLLSVLGLALGLVGAFGMTRLLTGMLVGVKPSDLATYVVVIAVFLLVSVVATWVPARYASGLDPSAALRIEGN